MTQQTAAPYTVTDLTVPYGEKIAISTNGGGIVTIWYQTGIGVSPPGFYVHDRINNEEVLLGTFAAEQVVRIDTSGSPALYDIGASPSVGSGDADTLKGYSPDATDTADTVVLRDSSGDIQANAFESTVATGTAPFTVASTTVVTNLNADALDGISSGSFLRSDAADTASSVITFSAAPVLANNISLSATETGATIRTVLSMDGSNIFQIGSANNTTNIRSSGTLTHNGVRVSESGGYYWTSRTSAADNNWRSVTYGNGLFVAVSITGTGDRAMTSPDGINWTSRTSAADNDWYSVTYGNGLFVAVSITGTGDRVMTSPDGINWTSRTSAADNDWYSVTYGNGLFVAVAATGTGDRAMTSPDGINWTSRTSAADNNWTSVTYGNGLFVAVAVTGTGDRVMTSPDGINWTSRTSAADNNWNSVTYGNGLFVAVAATGTGDRVMTSPDGINWTSRTSAAGNSWRSVTYGNGLFVAVASTGTGDRVMTSPDGINWTSRTSAAGNSWYSVTYGNGLFVAVSITGTGDRAMTSGKQGEIKFPTSPDHHHISLGDAEHTTEIRSNGTLTYNGASLATGSIDTTAAQTITVVDGLITSIV